MWFNNYVWFVIGLFMLFIIGLFVGIILGANMAHAHSWYDPQCCSNTDCRSVSDDDILDGTNDYVYLPLGLHFPKSMEKPSHDKNFHVCYGSGMLNGKVEYSPLCIYTRQGY